MIDEDDPAFMDLNKLFHAKGLSNDDQPDMDEDDEEGDEPRADVDVDVDHNAPDTVELDPSDAWISAIVESGDSHKIGIMSVCVLSNEVKAALLDKDEDRKQLADYLDLLQVHTREFMQYGHAHLLRSLEACRSHRRAVDILLDEKCIADALLRASTSICK